MKAYEEVSLTKETVEVFFEEVFVVLEAEEVFFEEVELNEEEIIHEFQ